jgi:hypothetical protein
MSVHNHASDYYGHSGEDRYPLAARIWGHRLRIGQHWIEYLLEFLNVLAGFDYQLGQGVDNNTADAEVREEYRRFMRLGLRRFVFYDEREKTKDPYDDRAQTLLWQRLEEYVAANGREGHDNTLFLVRDLFRAFSALEEDRSWFAKSLFPAHHNLLFWEALRRSKPRNKRPIAADASPSDLDKDISLTERNFFARGGEIYYLILSAGTEEAPTGRDAIARNLQALLTRHNQTLGQLAELIDRTWRELYGPNDGVDLSREAAGNGTLGWILDPSCPFYRRVAEDLETFLQSKLDTLECLELVAHLISFHLVQYIYHRAHPQADPERHQSGACLTVCRPLILIDALEGEGNTLIRSISAALFREQEDQQVQKARTYVKTWVDTEAAKIAADSNFALKLVEQTDKYFNIGMQQTRRQYENAVSQLQTQFRTKELDSADFASQYTEVLLGAMLNDFRKNFLGVHRKLAKAGGLVAPRKGPGGRFVLSDTLLKTLVLANLLPGKEMPFDLFLQRLYNRYGLVVGPEEARLSGLIARQRINVEYYSRNRAAFLMKMQNAGLLVQYSDATALVQNGPAAIALT